MQKKLSGAYQIYALIDPKDNLARYIGVSRDAEERFYGHTKGNHANIREGRWMKRLREQGLSPILEILETIDDSSGDSAIACEREQYWICEMVRLGHPLFNVNGNTSPYQYPASYKRDKQFAPKNGKFPTGLQAVVKEVKIVEPVQTAHLVQSNKQIDSQQLPSRRKETLMIRDVVKELDVNDKTVRRWIQNGELQAERDILGRYRIKRVDLEDFIRRRKERFGSKEKENE